jgi:hypothetical protein
MVDSQLGTSGILPKNPDVDCKRDTCRIVADFRSTSDAADWAVLYLTVLGADYVGTAQPLFVNKADGSTQMRMFASRKASTSRSPDALSTND